MVGLVEGVLAIEVVERDDAARAPAGHERDPERGLRHLAGEHEGAVPLSLRVEVLTEQQWLARVEHVVVNPLVKSLGSADRRSPRSTRYGKLDEPARSRNGDADALSVEDLLDLVADGVVDRLLVELARDRILHAVDQRQLGVPLPRLLDRARPRERRADVLADEGEQLLVLLGEVEARCVRRNSEDADRSPLGRVERNAQPVFGSLADQLDLAFVYELRDRSGVNGELLRPEDVGRDASRITLAELDH